ncbi:hypothetical protein CYY_002189 [Polysphondylium violaceum]|uniref:THUMP domain-containing protein n=1 Tax=Polysphondylium violaceum TaxID=133409 RepID=A0A8J4Q874_9MYCE|nr:hypothetical protein CYY_002189 [Polysphondylium violaceum]
MSNQESQEQDVASLKRKETEEFLELENQIFKKQNTSSSTDLPVPNAKVLSDPIYGCKGLMYTFDSGRERQATKDIHVLMDQYLQPYRNNNSIDNNSSDSSYDFNAEFLKELQQVRDENKRENRLYKTHSLKCNGLGFISFRSDTDIDPIDIVNRICLDVEKDKLVKTKEITRVIPILKTCHVSQITPEIKLLIDKYFKNNNNQIIKYKIEFKSRNNSKIHKMDYIQEIAKTMDPSKHKVDLVNPDLTIIVEIINFFCALSIVSNFEKCKKFNLANLAGLPPNNIPKGKKNNSNNNNNKKSESKEKVEQEEEKEPKTSESTSKKEEIKE